MLKIVEVKKIVIEKCKNLLKFGNWSFMVSDSLVTKWVLIVAKTVSSDHFWSLTPTDA